ncbi:hypothetical protein D7Z26_12585 [Cohnella endophytica]|uniref:Permease n=1 Tax=Cohnella endophytica TaxID=2419778 RepID=A0A494Y1H8_9BACL|nr:hypothetical protein [Cohnella endophytica]RKP54202.1 hypothetical protein D7Z26_12585 [Cohnella endophytica]
MVRYFYYHVIYVGLINIMLFVPYTLIQNRFHGAVPAIVISIFLGTALAYVTISLYLKFPEMGLPEILNTYLPRTLALTLILLTTVLWFSGGMLVIYSYSRTIQQFFNPDMNPYLFSSLMIAAAIWGGTRCTRTVQFAQEIVLFACAPLILALIMKAIFSKWLSWDAIRITAGYVKTMPSFLSLAAAMFVFAGFNTLAVFNRLVPADTKIRFRWIIPVFCTLIMLISFFVPIGFHGTVGVGQYVYIWSITADSMIMEYGFIQRVLYVFLLLFTALTLMFAMNTWHSAAEFLKSCHPKHRPKTEQYPVPASNWWINASFGGLTLLYAFWADDSRNEWTSHIWLYARFSADLLAVVVFSLILLLKLRPKQQNKQTVPKSASSDS